MLDILQSEYAKKVQVWGKLSIQDLSQYRAVTKKFASEWIYVNDKNATVCGVADNII